MLEGYETKASEKKIEQTLKNMPQCHESEALDSQRKENNWKQIQHKLYGYETENTATSTKLAESVEGRGNRGLGEQHVYPTTGQPKGSLETPKKRHRNLWLVMRTGAAVVVGVGIVAYVAHALLKPGTEATEAHNDTNLSVSKKQNFPSGVSATGLPSPVINPGNTPQGHLSRVSPNGNWVIVQQEGHTVLRNISARKDITLPTANVRIYAATPDGSLILGVAAGAGHVTESLNPKTGSVKKLPGNPNPMVDRFYAAAKSLTGHWAMTVATSSGSRSHEWVDVDGQKVPSLQGTSYYAWSPAGNTLAAIVSPSVSSAMKSSTVLRQQVVLYNAKTGQTHAPKAAEFSTTLGKVAQFDAASSAPIWSPNGKYVLYWMWNNVYVFNVKSGTVAKLPIQDPAFMGFMSNNRIYAVSGDSNQTDVQWFTLKPVTNQSVQIQTNSTWHAPQPINGVVDVGSLLLVGIRGSAGGDAPGSGEVLSLVGTHATTVVAKSADYWWYDAVNQHIYFYLQDDMGNLKGHVMTKAVVPLEGQSS